MFGRIARLLICLCALAGAALAQETAKVSLDVSESLFSVLAAMNACGYDQELSTSDPLRAQIRTEVTAAVTGNAEAGAALHEVCTFYRDHAQRDPSRNLAQYESLAIYLGRPPKFELTAAEADLPPDASYVLGFVQPLQHFYTAAGLSRIWEKHRAQYEGLVDHFHDPVAKMVLSTDVFLNNPVSAYLGRRFAIYLDPLAPPGQVNARIYGPDYFMIMSPAHGTLDMAKIRHMYLHFIVDPLAMKRARLFNPLEPLLYSVKMAPLDETFKNDISLLVTESLIRAVEAAMVPGKGKDMEHTRRQLADDAASEGFILAPYFYERLLAFEKEPAPLNDAYGVWLHDIDVQREQKRASQIVFKGEARQEVVAANVRTESPLDEAEKRLAAGESAAAKEMAEAALRQKQDDAGRAYFILAQVASQNRDVPGTVRNFELALENTKLPRITAWSHIYLARILDLQGKRDQAVEHYQAALEASRRFPGARAAAEKGLQQPFTTPISRGQTTENRDKH